MPKSLDVCVFVPPVSEMENAIQMVLSICKQNLTIDVQAERQPSPCYRDSGKSRARMAAAATALICASCICFPDFCLLSSTSCKFAFETPL